jgi:hypothetical protein
MRLESYFFDLRKKKSFLEEIEVLRILQSKSNTPPGRKKYLKNLENLCLKYNLGIIPWSDVFDNLVYYGDAYKPDFTDRRYDSCLVRSFVAEDGQDPELIAAANRSHPIAICANPYSSVEDIKKYIDANREFIKIFLESHQIRPNQLKNYRAREAKIAARYAFIYKNRDMPMEELKRATNDEFGTTMSHDEITKALAREKTHRQ